MGVDELHGSDLGRGVGVVVLGHHLVSLLNVPDTARERGEEEKEGRRASTKKIK